MILLFFVAMGFETFGGNVESANTQFVSPTEQPKQTFDDMTKDIGEKLKRKGEHRKFLQEQALSPSLANARVQAERILQNQKGKQTVVTAKPKGTTETYSDVDPQKTLEAERDKIATLLLAGVGISIGGNGELLLNTHEGAISLPSGLGASGTMKIPADQSFDVSVMKDTFGRRQVSVLTNTGESDQLLLNKSPISVPILANTDDFLGTFSEKFRGFSTGDGVENSDFHLHIDKKGESGSGDIILSVKGKNGQKTIENTLISLSPSYNGEKPLQMDAKLTVLPGTAIFDKLQEDGILKNIVPNTPHGAQEVKMSIEDVFQLMGTLKNA